MKVISNVAILGCDPELMIVNNKTGSLRSATEILTGTKESPQKVKKGGVLSDNVNLEFNTDPAKTSKEWIKTIGTVLRESDLLVGRDNKLIVRASADFPKEALLDPKTQEFGCEPDYDAWKMAINQIDSNAATKTFRSAGGHIHVGMTAKSKKLLSEAVGKCRVVKAMDLILGIISVLIDHDTSSPARRELYGKAGSHRPKSYGVEYRALGPFWVESPKLVDLMYNLTCISVQLCLMNKEQSLIDSIGANKIQNTINKSDLVVAREIFDSTISKILTPTLNKVVLSFTKDNNFNLYKEWNL